MAVGSRSRNRTSKAEQAGATRLRIVRAATELFVRDGFVTTTMAAVAKEAGVSVQTLYLSFGSKTTILHTAFDAALVGGDGPDGILETDWFQQVQAEPDGEAALRLFCARTRLVVERAAPLWQVMRAASADPEVAEVLGHNQRQRSAGYRMIVEALASRAGFAPGLPVEDALVILCTVVSEDSFLLMVTELGWSPDRWQEWVTETCVAQFFPG